MLRPSASSQRKDMSKCCGACVCVSKNQWLIGDAGTGPLTSSCSVLLGIAEELPSSMAASDSMV